MTKIIAILANAPLVMSGCYNSSNQNYKEFISDYNSKRIHFGSMGQDRANYSKDMSNVLNDYKSASLKYTQQLKEIG